MTKPVSIDDWCFQYEKVRPDYLRFTSKIQSLVEDLLQARGIGFHVIESRTKEISSFREKITRTSKSYSDPLTELTDLSGLRIVTYYQSDASLATELIKAEFDIDNSNSIEHSPCGAEFGYRSAHYVVRLSKSRSKLLEWGGLADFRIEIQVRTVLQHAWAAVSHKLQYKRETDIPEQLRRKLFRLSALFEIADDEFIALRDASTKLSEEINAKLSHGNQNIKIDYVSLSQFLEKSDAVSQLCQHAIDAGFSFEFYEAGEIPIEESVSDLIQVASFAEVSDIAALDSALRDASSWARQYLIEQYEEGESDNSSTWYATPAFICILILIKTFISKMSIYALVQTGWDADIASRVLKTAVGFEIYGEQLE